MAPALQEVNQTSSKGEDDTNLEMIGLEEKKLSVRR
jgi:hypothetical protein